jgi:hypothetical protein
MDEKGLKLPQKTIVAIVVGFVLLLGLGLGIHLTYNPKISSVEQRINENSQRLEAFKNLYPVYNKLSGLLEEYKERIVIPYTPKISPERDIAGFGVRVATICEQTKMHFVSVQPRPESIQSDKDRILVNTVIRGEFVDFRDFLIHLLQVHSLIFIEQVQVRSMPENREYALSLWVHFT